MAETEATTDTKPTTPPPAALPTDSTDWKAEAEKARKEAETYRAAEKDRSDKEKAAKRKSDDDKRMQDGEAKRLVEEKSAELEREKERASKLEKTMRERLDKQLAKLPEASRKKIDLVKDALDLATLTTLVEAEAEGVDVSEDKAPPSSSPRTAKTKDGNRRLQERTYSELGKLGVSPAIAERHVEVQETEQGGSVFRIPVQKLIPLLNSMAAKPRPMSREQWDKEHKA